MEKRATRSFLEQACGLMTSIMRKASQNVGQAKERIFTWRANDADRFNDACNVNDAGNFKDAGISGQSSPGDLMQSPICNLSRFGQAKRTVNDIFFRIAEYIAKVDLLLQDTNKRGCIDEIDFRTINASRDKVKGIMEILGRDHMKVVFFGRTSNGKSTVINAMLREKILPSGIGHTTNCFLQVEGGTDSQKPYILTDDRPNKRQRIQLIDELADARRRPENVKSESPIRIVLPREKCPLLNDVVFVDSPGIDANVDLDKGIDKFCLNADVFVLVVDGVATLTQTETNFFHRVKERITKPNLFILHNKWDLSEEEDDKNVRSAKENHIEWSLKFLNELGVTDRQNDTERVFFVSAREALDKRLNRTIAESPKRRSHERYEEFEKFEKDFEESISKSAVKTKFGHLSEEGKKVTEGLKQLIDKTFTPRLEQKLKCTKREIKIKEKLKILTDDIRFQDWKKDVQEKVSSDLNKMIEELVNKFNKPFNPDPEKVNYYKKELHEHVCNRYEHIRNKCLTVLKDDVAAIQAKMTEHFLALLPEETVKNIIPKQDFVVAFLFDFYRLFDDFKEHIEFHFSRRQKIVSIISPFAGVGSFTFGIFGVQALVAKTAFIAMGPLSLIVPIGIYVHGQFSWNDERAERAFKEQYVNHATGKLHLIVDETIRQAEKELTSAFARLRQHVEVSDKELAKELKVKADDCRKKADRLDENLNDFTKQYLQTRV